MLDSGRKQFVQIADSGDVDRPDALTISFFFLSLHNADDSASHGICAKRIDQKEQTSTNFGINYVPKTDTFQVYLNHGSGFRVAAYSAGEVLGSRRRVFLTATLERGDAPAPDDDTEADDIRVRLFANGKQVKPTKVTEASLTDSDAWITDVDPAKLLNDTPLTLGATNAASEFTSGVLN